MTDVDTLLNCFLKLEPERVAALEDHPNESDTRLNALDRILFKVLGWRHESVMTEPPTDSGFIGLGVVYRGALVVLAALESRQGETALM